MRKKHTLPLVLAIAVAGLCVPLYLATSDVRRDAHAASEHDGQRALARPGTAQARAVMPRGIARSRRTVEIIQPPEGASVAEPSVVELAPEDERAARELASSLFAAIAEGDVEAVRGHFDEQALFYDMLSRTAEQVPREGHHEQEDGTPAEIDRYADVLAQSLVAGDPDEQREWASVAELRHGRELGDGSLFLRFDGHVNRTTFDGQNTETARAFVSMRMLVERGDDGRYRVVGFRAPGERL